MTDNEKLLDEVRNHGEFENRGWMIEMIDRLADALEAAEKAHTLTDDEREAIIAAIDAIRNPFATSTRQDELLVFDAAEKWASGPVGQEPSRDRGWSHPDAVYSPEVFSAIQELLNEARGEPMHALRLAVSRQLSEPQGEPSDVTVAAAVAAYENAGGKSHSHKLRAALIAAAGVR